MAIQHGGIGQQFRTRAATDDGAARENDGVVGHGMDFQRVLFDKHCGQSFVAHDSLERPQQLLDDDRGARISRLSGVCCWSDMLTAISPRQLYYELEADRLAVIQVSLPETQRQIGITEHTDSDPSPAARLLITVNPGVCASAS